MIKTFGSMCEDICELKQAENLVNFKGGIIQIDGQRIRSYDELVRLASHDKYRNREYIEVVILPVVPGG